SARDLSVAIELVNGSEQKGLMQHRRQQGIGHAMSGDVDQRDPALVLTSLEVLDNVQPAFGTRTVDACLEIEPRLEVEVGDVVPPDGSAPLERAAPDVKALESGDLTWKRDQLLRNVLEILQLTGEPLQLVSGLRFVDEHVGCSMIAGRNGQTWSLWQRRCDRSILPTHNRKELQCHSDRQLSLVPCPRPFFLLP